MHISLNDIEARFHVTSDYPGGVFAIETMGDERPILSKLLNLVNKGNVVYDVGAGLGLYTILLSKRVGDGGRVVAFEPDRQRFKMLEFNISLNECKNVSLFQTALGRRNSIAHLKAGKPDELSDNEISEMNDDSIQVVHGDAFVDQANLPIPDAVKIDVEGFEEEVLAGLKGVLKEKRCKYLLCEIHPTRLPRTTDESTIMAMIHYMGFVPIQTRRKSKANFHAFFVKIGVRSVLRDKHEYNY